MYIYGIHIYYNPQEPTSHNVGIGHILYGSIKFSSLDRRPNEFRRHCGSAVFSILASTTMPMRGFMVVPERCALLAICISLAQPTFGDCGSTLLKACIDLPRACKMARELFYIRSCIGLIPRASFSPAWLTQP